MGLGFPHHAGRYRPGRTRSSSPGCRSYRHMEGCLNRTWGPIVPRFGRIGGFAPRGNPRRAPALADGGLGGGGSTNGIGARRTQGLIAFAYYIICCILRRFSSSGGRQFPHFSGVQCGEMSKCSPSTRVRSSDPTTGRYTINELPGMPTAKSRRTQVREQSTNNQSKKAA